MGNSHSNQQLYNVDGVYCSSEDYYKACNERNINAHAASRPQERGVRAGDQGPVFNIEGKRSYIS
jgi:hypothetical protein